MSSLKSLKLIVNNRAYFSVVWVFCSLNIMIGTWVLYIPIVKAKLALNDAQLGFALFCLALGILVFLPLVPFLTRKIGLGKTTFFGILLFSLSFTTPVIAPSYFLLCCSLFLVGMFSGCTDIAMNALISEIEKRDNEHLMSSSHGFFSLGGVIGGLLGTFLIGVFKVPFYHMSLMAIFIVFSNLLLMKYYFNITEVSIEGENKKSTLKTFSLLIPLAIIAFVIMASEGAIEHWSSLYLIDTIQIEKEHLAGLGFILFSITMTIGRFFGDGISTKIGSLKTILYGSILAALGYLLVLLSQFIISVIGFGIIGLGLSVIIPELFRLAGKAGGASSSANISFVSGIGFIGFLLGPVCLGFISNVFNLKMSFTVLLFLLCIAIGIALIKFRKS